jgi:hypothetical protein
MWQIRSEYIMFIGKYIGRRLIERSRCRWDDIIKINLKRTECGSMDYIEPNQDRTQLWVHVNITLNPLVP